jgi:hypothetical protein
MGSSPSLRGPADATGVEGRSGPTPPALSSRSVAGSSGVALRGGMASGSTTSADAGLSSLTTSRSSPSPSPSSSSSPPCSRWPSATRHQSMSARTLRSDTSEPEDRRWARWARELGRVGYGDTLTEGEEKARRREGMVWWEGKRGREWALSLQRLSGTRGRGPPYVCLRPDPAPSPLCAAVHGHSRRL